MADVGEVLTIPEALAVNERDSSTGLSFRSVTKTFQAATETANRVLDEVDLEVDDGEFVCLLGPSGCGKTTLLNIAAGFLSPDSGTVNVGGRRVSGPGPDRCVLFQSPTLFPWLTTKDNVLFGPRARRVPTHNPRPRASELLAAVGLGEFEEHYPHQLSGGMRHRAAFARALINDPTILLMDEPFGALDAITRAGMQEFLLDLWQRTRMTVLFVTHDVEEATLLADRVCVMSTGPGRIVEIVSVGLPRPRNYDMTESAEFVALKRRIRQLVEQGSRRK
jgi:NitT/TauT family transport system ATP-binding protein